MTLEGCVWDTLLLLQCLSSNALPSSAQTFRGISLRNCGSVTFFELKLPADVISSFYSAMN